MSAFDLECHDKGLGQCYGPVKYRPALGGVGISFPRCTYHWNTRPRLEKR